MDLERKNTKIYTKMKSFEKSHFDLAGAAPLRVRTGRSTDAIFVVQVDKT